MKGGRNRWELLLTGAAVLWIAVVFARIALTEPRGGGADEISLFNPVYMKLWTGKLAYPSYGFPDGMFIHPPVHVGFVALLIKAGLSLYVAEALPGLLWLFLALAGIALGPFGWPIRVGLLTGLYAPATWLGNAGYTIASFGLRPDLEAYSAWMAGLIWMEWGRLDGWDWRKLAVGSFLLTYSSGVHYYAAFGFVGVLIYGYWALRSLPHKHSGRVALAMAGGGLLMGVPYLAMFVIPMYRGIRAAIEMNQGVGGVWASLMAHVDIYALVDVSSRTRHIAAAFPVVWRVPAVLFSTALLCLLPSTRGLAILALPVQLFLLLFATHKLTTYLSHELALFAVAVVAVGVTVLSRFVRYRAVVLPLSLVPLAWLVTGSLDFQKLRAWSTPKFHEMDIARAAGKEMLGPDARVGYRLSLFYFAGEAHWYLIDPDLHWSPRLKIDPKFYLPLFDAIVVNRHFSEKTDNTDLISSSSLYATGALNLRGFFWAEDDIDFGYLLLASKRSGQITGFARANGRLWRFAEAPGGDHELISAVCPVNAEEERWRQATPWSHYLYLPPRERTSRPSDYVTSAIFPRGSVRPLPSGCRELVRTQGRMEERDTGEMVAGMRRQDKLIQFHSTLEDFTGPERAHLAKWARGGPPEGSVRLAHAFLMSEASKASSMALVWPGDAPRTEMPAGMGQYGLSVPLSSPGPVNGVCWVEARLRIPRGKISLAARSKGADTMLAESPAIAAGANAREIFLPVPSCAQFDELITRGADSLNPSEASVEGLSLWVGRSDWNSRRAALKRIE